MAERDRGSTWQRTRKLNYQEQIDRLLAEGWHIDRQTDTYTVLHKGEEIGCAPQCIDMVLIFLTGGLWIVVYLVQITFFGLRERRVVKLPDGRGPVKEGLRGPYNLHRGSRAGDFRARQTTPTPIPPPAS